MTSVSPCGKQPKWLTNQTEKHLVQKGIEGKAYSDWAPEMSWVERSKTELGAKFTLLLNSSGLWLQDGLEMCIYYVRVCRILFAVLFSGVILVEWQEYLPWFELVMDRKHTTNIVQYIDSY